MIRKILAKLIITSILFFNNYILASESDTPKVCLEQQEFIETEIKKCTQASASAEISCYHRLKRTIQLKLMDPICREQFTATIEKNIEHSFAH